MEFFYDPDNTTINNEINPFKRKSKWTRPINREPALETYVKSVEREIQHDLDRGPTNAPMITSEVKKERLCRPCENQQTSS